jgi:hypothetical protein
LTVPGAPGIISGVEENSRWAFLKSPRTGVMLVVLGLLAVGGLAGHYFLNVKTEYALTLLRAEAQMDLLRLEALQLDYKKRHGAFAADLGALLGSAPDGGAALRARLKEHTHLETLVVDGDADGFRLEANVRDAERTLLVIRGPRPSDLREPAAGR